tara:strand:+ start:10900 stop:11043 length:144 start_codon:yes stop_codon:yes gene_type:complete
MTVGQLETEMSNRELLEWMFFYKIEHEIQKEAMLDAQLEAKHKSRSR